MSCAFNKGRAFTMPASFDEFMWLSVAFVKITLLFVAVKIEIYVSYFYFNIGLIFIDIKMRFDNLFFLGDAPLFKLNYLKTTLVFSKLTPDISAYRLEKSKDENGRS
jgi:hypothetical protein